MKATELRIGNLIYDICGGKCVVRGITSKGIWIRDKGGPASENSFNPIPITEQWLLKSGLYKHDGCDYYLCVRCEMAVYLESDYCRVYAFNEVDESQWLLNHHLQYLHQLQNLFFALTGEELTITT